LGSDGYRDRKRINERLKEHEISVEHITSMNSWNELRTRLGKQETIDKELQQQISKEKERIRQVLMRIVVIVKFLGRRNLAFRGCNEQLYNEGLTFLFRLGPQKLRAGTAVTYGGHCEPVRSRLSAKSANQPAVFSLIKNQPTVLSATQTITGLSFSSVLLHRTGREDTDPPGNHSCFCIKMMFSNARMINRQTNNSLQFDSHSTYFS
jgi:hypothetical protein